MLEDKASRKVGGDDILEDDVYITNDGLEEDCLDLDVIGYIQITSTAPPHFPIAPRGSTIVGIVVPSRSSNTPGSRPIMEMVIGEGPPAKTTLDNMHI